MLRCIGDYIDMTGIPELWIESGAYGETTVKHLLEGKPLRRIFREHVTKRHAFNELLFEQFFQLHPLLFQRLDALTCETRKAWQTGDRLCIQTAIKRC